ncbi:MAG: hypothetical protein MH252_14870 [Thermosynechococcaceae cyanobacterium MS004]|nr:hypothetical protein [Thermosynechococcaceae cyanobacterium MS004]
MPLCRCYNFLSDGNGGVSLSHAGSTGGICLPTGLALCSEYISLSRYNSRTLALPASKQILQVFGALPTLGITSIILLLSTTLELESANCDKFSVIAAA